MESFSFYVFQGKMESCLFCQAQMELDDGHQWPNCLGPKYI